jgi:hypothetical protein
MSPHESVPLVFGKHKNGISHRSKMRRVSSIAKELGPEAQKGTASLLNVGINMSKTAGKKNINGIIIHSLFFLLMHVLINA